MRFLALSLLLGFTLTGCDQVATGLKPSPETVTSAPAPAGGPVQVYFTRPGNDPTGPGTPANALVGYIHQTRQSIDVCAFELDNKIIVEALIRAVQRGVRVRLVTETNYLQETGVAALKAVGVPIVDDGRDGALMHNKFMVFDGKSIWTGSMNFTENCAYKNNNHGIFIDDPRIAANYATKFGWMFDEHKFGGLPSKSAQIPSPVVTLADGTVVENYFSTHDHIARHVTSHLTEARQSIRFLAFSFTHKGIGEAMIARARTGVEVSGVFEKSQTAGGHSEYSTLRGIGSPVLVLLDANQRNMHHKVIVIDGETTVAGSFNFSESADKTNDENVVIFRSRSIAQQFDAEFRTVFDAARRVEVVLGSR